MGNVYQEELHKLNFWQQNKHLSVLLTVNFLKGSPGVPTTELSDHYALRMAFCLMSNVL